MKIIISFLTASIILIAPQVFGQTQNIVGDKTLQIQFNPGGTFKVSIPDSSFIGFPLDEPGLLGKRVSLFPADAATLYYDGNIVASKLDIVDFDATKVALDPKGSDAIAITARFKYEVFDAPSVSSVINTITVPFAEFRRN